ncbi:MAG: hypothetical protein OJF60_002758 [Burkholderiaceae bacterium]|nr:MAG: hypothetical protein OJF60_002758 [Burkholderiaceae bacterium]
MLYRARARPGTLQIQRHRRPRSRPCGDTRGAGFAGPLTVPSCRGWAKRHEVRAAWG